jgi:hypothetical protein
MQISFDVQRDSSLNKISAGELETAALMGRRFFYWPRVPDVPGKEI